MNVYLAERNTKFDLSALDSYGDKVYIADGQLNPFNTDVCIRDLQTGLKDFDPMSDYICMTGNILVVSLMMMVAYSMFPVFKVLLFEARSSNYRERIINHV